MKTITIIGGGLGGLALGIYLRRLEVPVRLIEAGSYPKHKVCGEFICGVSPEWLSEMGLDNIVADSVHHHEMSWWMGSKRVLETPMPTVAWGLSRYQLDLDLSRKFVELGGELILGQRGPAEDVPGTVIGVGKKKTTGSDWIGLKIHVAEFPIEGLEMHVGSAGYVGLCEVERQQVNICGLFKVQKELRGKDLLRQYLRANGLTQLEERIGAATAVEGAVAATAGFQLGAQDYEGGFRLGDAAYLIPPFSGNGMSMALESAYLAGRTLQQYARSEISWEQVCEAHEQAMQKHFTKRMKWAETLHPLLFSSVGRASLKAAAPVLPIRYLFERLRRV